MTNYAIFLTKKYLHQYSVLIGQFESRMIKNSRKLDKFYRELEVKENLSYSEALRIYEALYKEALAFGVISDENIWDGFEAVLRIARAVNGLTSCKKGC